MKTNASVFSVSIIVTVLLISASGATGKKMVEVDDAMKSISGIWVNTEYSGTDIFHPQKFVLTSDGRVEFWMNTTLEYPTATGKYNVTKSWTDLKGNLYSTIELEYYDGDKSQDLWKLDKSGNTLEVNYRMAGSGYPERIDPNPRAKPPQYEYYFILYRQ